MVKNRQPVAYGSRRSPVDVKEKCTQGIVPTNERVLIVFSTVVLPTIVEYVVFVYNELYNVSTLVHSGQEDG